MSTYALVPLVSAGLVVAVETLLIAPGHVLAGQLADAVLILMLLNAGALLRGDSREARAGRAAMHALALVPLIRVVGAGLPLRDLSSTTEQLLLAVPVGAAALFLAPVVGVPRAMFVTARQAHLQIAAIASGLGLGLVAYVLGATALWPAGAAGDRIALAIAVAIVAAAVQEIVFRGVVQVSLQRVAGRAGLVASIVLFSATYLDADSIALVITGALAGVVFAYTVARTATLGGVLAGQALFAVGAGGIWPALFGREQPTWPDELAATIVLATALTAATVILLWRPAARTVAGPGEPLEGRAGPPALEPSLGDHPPKSTEGIRRAPAVRPRTDRRTQVVALACVLIASMGIAGYFVGRTGEAGVGPVKQVTVGPLSLTLPGNWQQRSAEKALPSVALAGGIAGGPRTRPRAGIVAWRNRPTDADFLPDGFTAGPTRAADLVYLGRYDAYRHRGLRAAGDRLVPPAALMRRLQVTAYSIPTAAGAAVVVCYAPRSMARRFMAECEDVASTIDLRSSGAAARGTVAEDHRRLNAIVTKLAGRRSAARRRLAAARTPASQATAARNLRVAYRAARRSLEKSPAGPATRSRQAQLTAALTRVETGYGRLARAARQRSHRRYGAASRRITRSEAVLRRLLARPMPSR